MKTFILLLTSSTLLTAGIAYANESEQPQLDVYLTQITDQPNAVIIPLDLKLKVDTTPKIDRENNHDFEDSLPAKVSYKDVIEGFDADIGLLKSDQPDTITKSGALPRGRHIEPVNSKLGAGLTAKF